MIHFTAPSFQTGLDNSENASLALHQGEVMILETGLFRSIQLFKREEAHSKLR